MYSFWNSVLKTNNIPLTEHSISKLRLTPPTIGASPTGVSYIYATTDADFSKIKLFIENNFGTPPKTPILSPELSNKDIILYVMDKLYKICGCIRYSYAGVYERIPIYIIDCFCIESKWRKKGLGSYLLSALHYETMTHNLRYSIFLKESAPVFGSSQVPFYSSTYVYKQIPLLLCKTVKKAYRSNIWTLTYEQAHRIISHYKTIFPETFILTRNSNIEWRLYKQDQYSILVGCQDSFQKIQESDGSIGWITGWLESPNVTWPSVIERSNIIDTILTTFSYRWFWADTSWIQEAIDWKQDGAFHWYSYQWEPTLIPKGSYILNT